MSLKSIELKACNDRPIFFMFSDSASKFLAYNDRTTCMVSRVDKRSFKSVMNISWDSALGIFSASYAGSAPSSSSCFATAFSISKERFLVFIDIIEVYAHEYKPTFPRKSSKSSCCVRKYLTAASSLNSLFRKRVRRNFSSSALRYSITCSLELKNLFFGSSGITWPGNWRK